MGELEIPCWFDAQQRSTFQTSIAARRLLISTGLVVEQTIQLPVAGTVATLPLDRAEFMLAQLQCYADEAFLMTETHRAIVSRLTDIAVVDAYDYTTGYPESLTFNL
jgi:hypothetical protein